MQVERRDRVGDRVRRHVVRALVRVAHHILRVDLDRVVAELVPRDRLETLRALRQIRVALHPAERVEVHGAPSPKLALPVVRDADLAAHVEAVLLRAVVHQRQSKKSRCTGPTRVA